MTTPAAAALQPSQSPGIGSTFGAESHASHGAGVPWGSAAQITYVQSGGQALRLLSEYLWRDGRRQLVLPRFLCESMITPFATRPWRIRYYDVDRNLQPCLELVHLPHAEHSQTVILAAGYFGYSLSTDSVEALVHMQSAGVRIIQDRTHNVFDRSGWMAEFTVSSLRKLLPVGDGAVITGGSWKIATSQTGPGETYWRAMDLKASGDPVAIENSRAIFAAAEQAFERQLDPTLATSRTVETLERLPYAGMAEARRHNARILSELIGKQRVINGNLETGTPSHLVVRVHDPSVVQGRLASAGIYCPIHWPRPQQIPDVFSWPNDVLSLPVDHRYNETAMKRVAKMFNKVVSDG
jgi:hypothetical protein